MAVNASTLVQRAADIAQDAGAVRWTTDELVRWLNDAMREMEIYRPDAYAVTESVTLAAGARQQLGATAIKLIDIPCNTGGSKPPVRQVQRTELDAVVPAWRSMTGVAVIKHYMHDERAPRQFDVYPPAAGSGAAVDMTFAKYPTPIAEPGAGKTFVDVAGTIGVSDVFANALLDYMLYRTFMKDASFAGAGARAAAHYSQFASALGIEIKASMLVSPTPKAADASTGA